MAVDKNKIEFIYDEISEVLERSRISQETYNFLQNVKGKLDDLLYIMTEMGSMRCQS